MKYLVSGILKLGAEARLEEHAAAFNEHLSQPFRHICLAAALRDEHGKRAGYVVIIEAENFADAEAFLHQSPYYASGLYERNVVAVFDVEIGSIK